MTARTNQPSGFVSKAGTLPSVITPTGSPMTIQNTNGVLSAIVVAGGTVSLIEYSRDGSSWYPAGLVAGMFALASNDYLKVTYAIAPTTLLRILY